MRPLRNNITSTLHQNYINSKFFKIMAKLVGLIGTGRGKLGNMVLYKGAKGETLARAYQPQVFNPKSAGQTEQRSKINLIGQISKLVSKQLIKPFGGTGRSNRSEFNRELIKAVSVNTLNGFVAKISPADIKFSKGATIVQASASAVTLAADSLTLSLTLYQDSNINRYGERIVAVVYSTESVEAVSQVAFADIVLTDASAQSVTVKFGAPLVTGNVVAYYRVPFTIADAALATTYGEIYGTTTEIAAAITQNASSQLEWGNTLFVAAENFTNA